MTTLITAEVAACHEPPGIYRMQPIIARAGALIDVFLATAVVWSEARGESNYGRTAVAWAIRNRARRRKQAIAQSILDHPTAFAIDLRGMEESRTSLALQQCYEVVEAVLADRTAYDFTRGGDHFLTVELAESDPPQWYDPERVVARIGGHVFLRLLDEPGGDER